MDTPPADPKVPAAPADATPPAPAPGQAPAATPPASSPPLSASSPPSDAAAPSPEPAKPSPWSRPPPDRIRSNVRMAGVAMVLMGLLVAWQTYGPASAASHVFTDDEVKEYADAPGSNITVEAPSAPGATVAVYALNGTKLMETRTDAEGHARFEPGHAGVRVEVAGNGTTWVRKVVSIPGFSAHLRLDAASPAASDAWVQPDLTGLRWFWAGVAVGFLIVAAGVMAFRLRGPRIAMAGAVLFLAGAGALLALTVASGAAGVALLLQPILLTAMAAFAVWAFRKGRDRFTPVRVGGLKL